MNFNQLPYFLMYCASQNYPLYSPFSYLPLLQQNFVEPSILNQSSKELQLNGNTKKQSNSAIQKIEKSAFERELLKRKQKKFQSIKKQEKDIQFKQRQQTTNRNLCSNTLKVYFKQLRDRNSQTFLNINKILETNQMEMTVQDFMKTIDNLFPANCTYISFEKIKKVCNHECLQQEKIEFGKILRISLSRFYSYEIYAVNIKSIRTTRKIRNQQIKQGKIFLRELTL